MNQKNFFLNIYEVALGKRYQKRCWKVMQVDVGEVVGIAAWVLMSNGSEEVGIRRRGHHGENVGVGLAEQCVVGGREEALVPMVDVTKVGMALMESDEMFLVGLLV